MTPSACPQVEGIRFTSDPLFSMQITHCLCGMFPVMSTILLNVSLFLQACHSTPKAKSFKNDDDALTTMILVCLWYLAISYVPFSI